MNDHVRGFFQLLAIAHDKKLAGQLDISNKELVDNVMSGYRENIRFATGRKELPKDQCRRYYDQRREQGLCVKCNRKAIEGQVLCEHHREINREANRRTRQKAAS